MNNTLTDIVKTIIQENEVKVNDLSGEIEVGQKGMDFLQYKIDELNKKALKWKVPPISIQTISKREEPIKRKNPWGEEEVAGIEVYYKIRVEGDSPRIEGFTLVGKIQHTPEGENILNIAPNSPVKNLPEIYQTIKGECDVCKEKRERFNTFILQVDTDTSEHFTDKKRGDLVQVGSACLKRFLPGVSVDALLNYAKLIEELRKSISSEGDPDSESWDATEFRDRSDPNIYRHHVNTETLMKYIALVYVARGKFISKKAADMNNPATSEEAIGVMFSARPQEDYIVKIVEENPSLKNEAERLAKNSIEWMRQEDFHALGDKAPEWENYYHNMHVVAHSSTLNVKNAGYLAGVFSSYLRKENELKKASMAKGKAYVGKIGDKISFHGKLLSVYGPKPSAWGRGGIVIMYAFEDLDGNHIKWWTSKDLKLNVGETYPMTGIVKSQEIDKYSKQPTTMIKNGKIEKM